MESIERPSNFTELFQARKPPLGMMVGSTDPAVVEILGHSGFDFVVFDNERSPLDPRLVGHLVRAAEVSGFLPLARLVENDAALISGMLDAGVRGIILTHVESAADLQKAFRATRFAPQGSADGVRRLTPAGIPFPIGRNTRIRRPIPSRSSR